MFSYRFPQVTWVINIIANSFFFFDGNDNFSSISWISLEKNHIISYCIYLPLDFHYLYSMIEENSQK